ncbi:MAG: TrkH family potassium uptake protein [Lachnospiraceae bacterium]|nr:TrkH family potassium uptake protein [Lachnospiraceae bacterium]
MNLNVVAYVIGWVLQLEAAFMMIPAFVGLYYKEFSVCKVYVCIVTLCLFLGTLVKIGRKGKGELYVREGFASVALSWIVMSMFGALPFVFTKEITSYVNALFETVSGFTTTGISILDEVETLSKASLFWRSFTHWIGGMGVFMLILALLPMLGANSINLMRAESAGPSVDRILPKIRDTAIMIYSLYIGLTVLGTIALLISGMNLFESSTMIFGTVGTGGFSIFNDSAASLTPAQQWIIAIFMTLGAVNYTTYYLLLMGHVKKAFAIEEVRLYFIFIIVSVVLISINITHLYCSMSEVLRHAYFQVSSVITTAGFASTDFNIWPTFSKTVLLVIMLIGGCSGSTAGGFKVSRLIILMKAIKRELQKVIHPNMKKIIYMDNHVLSDETLRSANVFAAVYFLVLLISTVLISIDNFDLMTNFSAVATSVNGVGVAFEKVGFGCNFDIYSSFSKFVLMFDMIAGRLEFFPLLVLFVPSCWKKF